MASQTFAFAHNANGPALAKRRAAIVVDIVSVLPHVPTRPDHAQPAFLYSTTMDLTRHNTKFGMLAFDNCAEVQLNAALDLGDGITVHPACPINLPEHWRTWLGTLQTSSLVDANLLVCIQIDSATPTVLDGETNQIAERLFALRFGLFLHGIPDYRNNFIVLGGVDANGSASVRRVLRPELAFRHEYGRRPQITADTMVTTKECANGIRIFYEQPSNFRRLRAGFHACTRGMEEQHLDDRLHQYVRSLDGLTMLPPGQGKTEFSYRAQLFATGNAIAEVLEQWYQLRSKHEHLNDPRSVFAAACDEEVERQGSLRAYQAEQAALMVYQRLFSSPELLARFRTDHNIAAFWDLPEVERQTAWGDACDIDAAQADLDRIYALMED